MKGLRQGKILARIVLGMVVLLALCVSCCIVAWCIDTRATFNANKSTKQAFVHLGDEVEVDLKPLVLPGQGFRVFIEPTNVDGSELVWGETILSESGRASEVSRTMVRYKIDPLTHRKVSGPQPVISEEVSPRLVIQITDDVRAQGRVHTLLLGVEQGNGDVRVDSVPIEVVPKGTTNEVVFHAFNAARKTGLVVVGSLGLILLCLVTRDV